MGPPAPARQLGERPANPAGPGPWRGDWGEGPGWVGASVPAAGAYRPLAIGAGPADRGGGGKSQDEAEVGGSCGAGHKGGPWVVA
jgi:hypothetical protein